MALLVGALLHLLLHFHGLLYLLVEIGDAIVAHVIGVGFHPVFFKNKIGAAGAEVEIALQYDVALDLVSDPARRLTFGLQGGGLFGDVAHGVLDARLVREAHRERVVVENIIHLGAFVPEFFQKL